MNYLAIIVITFISGVIGTGLGGIVGAVLRRESNKIVSLLLSFAAGIMLAVVCFDLMSEPLEMMKEGILGWYAPFIVVASVGIGYAVVYLLNFVIDKRTNREVVHIDENHPQTADDLDELIHSNHLETHKNEKSNLFIAGLVMMFAIALHNLPEGMVIGASYAITLAWEIGNVEPHTDALLAGFDTYQSALLDVIFGNFAPSGRLPLTLPRNDEVLAVDANGVCVSPNDVPGYEKDRYMPDCMKDENGKAYAYRDRNGNYYEFGFGLRY